MSRALCPCLGFVNTRMGSWALAGPQFTYLCNERIARPCALLRFYHTKFLSGFLLVVPSEAPIICSSASIYFLMIQFQNHFD